MVRGIVAGCLGAALMATAGQAAEITVLSSTAMREPLKAMVPLFEQASSDRVVLRFESSGVLPGSVKAGAQADLVVTTAALIEDLVTAGKLRAGRTVALVRSGVGVAVRAGAPKPDISTPEAFRAALLAAKTVGLSKGPSGVHMAGVLERLGIAEQVKAKAVVTGFGERVGLQIADGHAEIGIQQITELLATPGIDVVGPLPPALQADIVYAVAPTVAIREPAAADALVRFLKSDSVVPILRKMGLEPA
jgi:molybdate transport system substrate-binding protein